MQNHEMDAFGVDARVPRLGTSRHDFAGVVLAHPPGLRIVLSRRCD
jgi:hypothetical protein